MNKLYKQYLKYHFHVYLFGIALFAISLSFSRFLLSASMFLLFINWLLGGAFREKWNRLKQQKELLVFSSFFLVIPLSLINTQHLEAGINSIIKFLPFIALPMIIGTSEKLTYRQLKTILYIFMASVIAHAMLSLLVFFNILDLPEHESRYGISLFFSHIRFALMVVFSIFSLGYFVARDKQKLLKGENWWNILSMVFLTCFLFILNSLTGILLFFFLTCLFAVYFIFKSKITILKVISLATIVSVALFSSLFFLHVYKIYYQPADIDLNNLDKKTANGNYYYHQPELKDRENGHLVYIYRSTSELEKAWNNHSDIPFDSLDQKGQHIQYTILRYMASKGLRKDSAGVASLSTHDIRQIEKGMTNYRFDSKLGLFKKIYEIIWEFDQYSRDGIPTGTLTWRLYSYQSAFDLISKNPLLGTGAGDIKNDYESYYQKNLPGGVENKRWIYGHNQFLSILISHGIIGLVWFLVAIFYPLFKNKGWKDYFFRVFFLISFASMFTEDTLKLQIGIAFFALFYALLLFGYKGSRL